MKCNFRYIFELNKDDDNDGAQKMDSQRDRQTVERLNVKDEERRFKI